tara:strand:+ start:1773 stop:2015 length:243 start_codon:yes stop_codon:yes gene_type:complete
MKRYQIDKINQLNYRVGHTMDLLNDIKLELVKLEREMEKDMIGDIWLEKNKEGKTILCIDGGNGKITKKVIKLNDKTKNK